jgi:hypothetical protein
MSRQRLSHGGDLLRPGHPSVYKATFSDRWCCTVWTKDRSGALVVPQTNTSHNTWRDAMAQVERWHRSGKWMTW